MKLLKAGACFNQYLGIRIVRTHADGMTIECPLHPQLLNASGVLHGGVTATLADVAVGQALARHLAPGRMSTTVELKVNYLRPVTGRKITARSHMVRIGKTLSIGRVDLSDDRRRLVAVALITYMLLGPIPAGARRTR